ncbi:hypothetical protein [Epilithonimonas sp. UC225_85]|uniref:hypothetical protein n=1 Tax=Epilithonimonas sp. UC225_85 TaxID=3350167 RepID=UPI0036D2EF3A
MKKLITALAIAFGAFCFSQSSLPQSSPKGTIITKTNQTIEFKNLKFEKGKITYIDKNTNTEDFLYDNSVKSMSYQDNEGNMQTYKAQDYVAEDFKGSNPELKSTKSKTVLKLTSDREIKDFLIQNQNQAYLSGKRLNNTGTAFLIGGGACVIIGAAINLSSADSVTVSEYNQKSDSKGSPIPIIIGLAGMGVGAVMKISGHSQMKKAVEAYKSAGVKKTTTSYYALADNKGLGLQIKF